MFTMLSDKVLVSAIVVAVVGAVGIEIRVDVDLEVEDIAVDVDIWDFRWLFHLLDGKKDELYKIVLDKCFYNGKQYFWSRYRLEWSH